MMSESPNDFRNIVAFKDDDAVRKALGRAADALEQAQTDHKELRKLYTVVSDRAYKRLSELRTAEDRIEQLEAALTECSDRLESCIKQTSEPYFAKSAVENYRLLIAGDSNPSVTGTATICGICNTEYLGEHYCGGAKSLSNLPETVPNS